jgi:hypothetical protein
LETLQSRKSKKQEKASGLDALFLGNGKRVTHGRAPTKRCRVCSRVRSINQFYAHQGAADGKRGECNICTRARNKSYKVKTQWHVENHKANKLKVFTHYGTVCVCCGETLVEGLTIDHINGDGAQHRKEIGVGGLSLYRWLIKHNYPEGFQTLCFTCNFAKGTKKFCPHQSTSGSKEIKH